LIRSANFFAVAVLKGLYSIHLENLLMATYTYIKPPGAGLKGQSYLDPSMRKAKMRGWSGGLVLAHVSAWQKMAALAIANECLSICYSGWPIKSS
jgi:hypothetical protein